MAGSNRIQKKQNAVVLQDRDRHLFAELKILRIVDREMAKIVAGFESTRRANDRLLRLTRARLLDRFFIGSTAHGRKAVYTLSTKSADLMNSAKGRLRRPSNRLVVGDAYVHHQFGINEIYLAVKYRLLPDTRLVRWLGFQQTLSEVIKLMPDAYFEVGNDGGLRCMFLEVDLGTEAQSVWQKKIAYYLQLAVSGEFHKKFGQAQFRVLVVANSDRRLAGIRATVSKSTAKIFWFTSFPTINREGIWSPIWLRPTGDQRFSLL